MSEFVELLQFAFMQKALVAGIAVSIVCAVMGMFLVLRRHALFGDGIAHVSFGGIALGLFIGIAPLWSALVISIIGGLGLQKLRDSGKISGDAAVAVILVSGLAIGVMLMSLSGGFSVDVFSYLFGSILLVSNDDLILILIVSSIVLSLLWVFRTPLLHLAFNEEHASACCINITLMNYLFVAMAALAVVASMRLVGILLISALIVLPNIAAMLLGHGFRTTIITSVIISVGCAVGGIFGSYYLDMAPSGMIAMLAVLVLLGILAYNKISKQINSRKTNKLA